MYSLGIDIGYSSIKYILINSDDEILMKNYEFHKGRIKEGLKKSFEEISLKYELSKIGYLGFTGSGGKLLCNDGEIFYLNEVAAIVEGTKHIDDSIEGIIEIGGESAKFITDFSKNSTSSIQIGMNSNCAAGTGSYLEEQMSRLGLPLDEYSYHASMAKSIPRIAGRCSVFAKTDITHHQQEFVPTADILLGLAYAVVRNYRGTVVKKIPVKKPIAFVGGVTKNKAVVTAIKDVFDLKDKELKVFKESSEVGALGVAIVAKNGSNKVCLESLISKIENEYIDNDNDSNNIKLDPLKHFGNGDALGKHKCKDFEDDVQTKDCYLGVDIGSTSTNLVIIDVNNRVIDFDYSRTLGNPERAVKNSLKYFGEKYGDKIKVLGVGITGSGRYKVGELIGADVIKDEITAQAKAAVTIDPYVDTIFEIGGQDSKYIKIDEGIVTDFQMNKICAAGTGSFIEEQAKKFDIAIEDFGELANSSENVIALGERCTVFMETSIAANISKGKELKDIASGLCYGIVQNYLSRVVGQKKVGEKIFFQGGVANNQGVVNAFRSLTGKNIIVPPFFSVTGALGVSILAKEESSGKPSKFKGFNLEKNISNNEENKKSNKSETDSFNLRTQNLLFDGYKREIDHGQKTIGIPRTLFTYGLFSMYNAMFLKLGYNVVLSEATSEKTVELGQKYTLDEACYPIKIIMGHVAELIDKKVDYVFFPNLYSVDHSESNSRINYGCAYMQKAFKVVSQAMDLEKKGITLLSPTIAYSMGKEFVEDSFISLGEILDRTSEEIMEAVKEGMMVSKKFKNKIQLNSEKISKGIDEKQDVFVIVSKIYGIADPILNMGIPERLSNMGYPVVGFYDIPEGNISDSHPNMFWPFGQHMLKSVEYIRNNPRAHGILLTHHGCGPDSILTHYFREEMSGKPYLHIEVDEHSSNVGVITRLEAFINSLASVSKSTDCKKTYEKTNSSSFKLIEKLNDVDKGDTIYLPNLYPYGEIFERILSKEGRNVELISKTTSESIRRGRKYSITEEYFSLIALLGDVFTEVENPRRGTKGKKVFYIPQNEGTETDGQYGRLIKSKLYEEGHKDVEILSPFMEDAFNRSDKEINGLFMGLLSGDVLRSAPSNQREQYLNEIFKLIDNGKLNIENLKYIALAIKLKNEKISYKKRILALGEKSVLYNNVLNNGIFDDLESRDYKLIYASFSEALAVFWWDYGIRTKKISEGEFGKRFDCFIEYMKDLGSILKDDGPFEKEFDKLLDKADITMGLYSGGFGRYRQAKLLMPNKAVNGIINISSMYENTGVLINSLHKEYMNEVKKPLINLNFDGNDNDQDNMKIESFLYYLK